MDSKKEKIIMLFMAIGVLVVGFGYLFLVTFVPIPETGKDHAKIIVGFLIGSALAGILGYFWGSSKGSADKNKLIDDFKTLSATEKK